MSDNSRSNQTPDWFNGRNLLEVIKAESARRRAAPLDFFCEFLRDIWRDNTPEEALRQWQTKVEQFPWYVDDVLYCLNAVIDQPPPNLEDILSECGWIELVHPPQAATSQSSPSNEGAVEPYSFDELVQWLVELRNQYQTIFNNAVTPLPDTDDDTSK